MMIKQKMSCLPKPVPRYSSSNLRSGRMAMMQRQQDDAYNKEIIRQNKSYSDRLNLINEMEGSSKFSSSQNEEFEYPVLKKVRARERDKNVGWLMR